MEESKKELKTKNPNYYKNYYILNKKRIDDYNKNRYYNKVKKFNLIKFEKKKQEKIEVKIIVGKIIISFK